MAVALGNLKSREAVPALIQALQDDDPLVRWHVAWALGQIGTPEALEALRNRLRIEADTEPSGEIDEAIQQPAAKGQPSALLLDQKLPNFRYFFRLTDACQLE